ncbi:MAG: ABC transporter ATP-binding protein [Phycisphaerales bacterium]|nr:ABC transporter ATP-binding protein [Phycisphaerales bacterium]MDG1979632.1 ABC transporter ATP-binding protein [Phycisphaerales bacterium]MDG2134092.1 ABC transporter ATP-binding protein [Phycisphaerales bacterium]
MTEATEPEDDFKPRHVDWRLWRRIAGHLRPYPRYVLTMIGCGLLLAVVEVLLPLVTAGIIDEATGPGRFQRIAVLGGVYAGLLSCFALLVWRFITAAGLIATSVAYDLRESSFARLQSLPFSYFDVRSTGWLVARVTSDVTKVTGLLPWFLLDLGWGTTMLVGIFTAMMLVDPQLGFAVSIIVPPMAIATWWFKRRMLESSRRIRAANSRITASYNETIAGVRTTRMLAREETAAGEFQVVSEDMRAWTVRNALQSAIYLPVVMSMGSIGVGIALWAGGVQVREETGLTLGLLIAFMQYAMLFSQPIQELAQRFVDLQSAQAAAERVQELIEETPAIRDSPEVAARIDATPADPPEGVASDGGRAVVETIRFEGIGHAYVKGERVLDDVSFELSRGTTLALVGATGSGKTTIAGLLARWYEPSEGRILVDGVDYRERGLDWWQSQFGVVQQVPHLFSGTIRDNVGYGRLDADDDAVRAALERVRALDFVETLEGGLDFEVGEGGGNLSQGQRQLVSLARAFLADPQLFIMDEATSSVDAETEATIQNAVEEILRDRIAVVIAHRLSTIRRADLILLLDQGRIIERGSHDELMAAGGRYRDLYLAQFVDEAERRIIG